MLSPDRALLPKEERRIAARSRSWLFKTHPLLPRNSRSEQFVIGGLMREGYRVLKRGWPDLIAIRGSEVRFIEVKSHRARLLSPAQADVASILSTFGIRVELVVPSVDGWSTAES